MRSPKSDFGKRLNKLWKVGAKHALYREDGYWYMRLERFPGALFDPNGYVLFETEQAFITCPYLRVGQRVHVTIRGRRASISQIPTYRRMKS
jgi:hypothetical protein